MVRNDSINSAENSTTSTSAFTIIRKPDSPV